MFANYATANNDGIRHHLTMLAGAFVTAMLFVSAATSLPIA